MFRAHDPQPSGSHPNEDVDIWVKIREKYMYKKMFIEDNVYGGLVEMRGIFESGKRL